MNINDIEIQRAVIGEILSFDSLRNKALLLEPNDFSYSEHRVICKEMIKQANEKCNYCYTNYNRNKIT